MLWIEGYFADIIRRTSKGGEYILAENNPPIAEAPAVAAVGEEPVVPAKVEANMERAEASATETQQNQEHRGNRDRDRDNDSNDDDDRDNRRRNRDDRQDAGRMQGPTDLMPELDPSQTEGEREELPDTRAYEVTYIVLANNEEAQNSTQDRLKAMIEAAGGAVDNARSTESRRLAFPIKKQSVTQTEGIYVVNNARFSQTLIPEMDRFFKLENNVLRHIILREGR